MTEPNENRSRRVTALEAERRRIEREKETLVRAVRKSKGEETPDPKEAEKP